MSADAADPRTTDELMDAGYAALASGDLDKATRVAEELRRRRHSSWFEIEARARWARDDRESAVALLEEGVGRVPKASPLWHWLACYRSDLGRYDAALEAFANEAEFEHVNASSNTYNVAVVYERMKRPGDALDVLDAAELPGKEGPSAAHFAELRARLLYDLGEFEQSIQQATEAIGRFWEQPDDDASLAGTGTRDSESPPDWDVHGRALAVRADAKLRLGDRWGAADDALEAIRVHVPDAPQRALEVLRRAEDQRSDRARQVKVLLEGELPPDEANHRRGFFMNVGLVADEPGEAIEWARRILPEAMEGLSVSEVVDEGPAGGELKGLYWCSPLHVFDPDAPEEDE